MATQPIDFRKGFDGLASICKYKFAYNLLGAASLLGLEKLTAKAESIYYLAKNRQAADYLTLIDEIESMIKVIGKEIG